MSQLRVLVIDDELLQLKIVSRQLVQLGFAAETAQSAAEGLELIQKKDFDVALLDVQMPGTNGLETLKMLKKLEDAPEVIMLTLDNSLESGIAAMREGAYDYLTKPAPLSKLDITIRKAVEKRRLIRRNQTLRDYVDRKTVRDEESFHVGENSVMNEILKQTESIANINSTVLITGESGTGKDVFARHIHNRSRRANSSIVAVNCGAMPENLFESEFFGYEKGAFSGATQTKRGLLEAADSSTLFLDEIGEMPLNLQVKLLRFLENGEFRRVGATRDLFSDARVIAATNRDLTALIREKTFRSDLYYRLNVISIHLPPLRERRGDVSALINHFLEFYRRQFHKPDLDFTSEARRKLEVYDFPGNVRELKNIIERAAVLARGEIIEADNIFFQKPNQEHAVGSGDSAGGLFAQTPASDRDIIALEELERRYILSVLNHTNGNRERAANLLGISERTLYRRLRDYE